MGQELAGGPKQNGSQSRILMIVRNLLALLFRKRTSEATKSWRFMMDQIDRSEP
jgi:hypothetical protein